MTARPIRYQRQVSDRKGKIFYTSITSLSHISKIPGHEAAYGWCWCGRCWYGSCTSALRAVLCLSVPA
ncbi:hypothetical protein NE606_14015 [Agathobaculum butyriciproducens]|nr:hypothetical protein [Agathobaculum butyriciproducens]